MYKEKRWMAHTGEWLRTEEEGKTRTSDRDSPTIAWNTFHDTTLPPAQAKQIGANLSTV